MRLWLRIALYVGGGGLLLSWVDPPPGLLRIAAVGVWIVLSAYLDPWLFRTGTAGAVPGRTTAGHKVVSLRAMRQSRQRRGAGEASGGGRERRVLHTVYSSSLHGDVDALLELLRSEGLNPVMVSQAAVGEGGGHRYDVRVPDKEVNRARPLIQFHQLKSTRQPS